MSEVSIVQALEPTFDGLPNLAPLPDRPKVASFDFDLLPDSVGNYVKDVSERMQCAPDFVAVSCLVCLAGVAGAKFRMRPKQLDTWEVVPNLWGATIGRPSSMKSPSLAEGLKPLKSIEGEARESFKADMQFYEIALEVAEIAKKSAKKKAEAGFKKGGAEAAEKALFDGMSGEVGPPTQRRYIVNDATTPKLGELLSLNPQGLIVERDELSGWLASMDKDANREDRAFYLEAFNGNASYTYDRIERGTIFIPNACVSMIGGLQPSKLAPLVKGAVTGRSDDGLLQRFQLAVWPDDVKGRKYIDRRVDADAFETYSSAVKRIADIESDEPIVYKFSEEAQQLFIQWWCELQANIDQGEIPAALESHMIKMQKTVPSLALIFALVEGEKENVGVGATAMALDWYDYLLSHAHRVYSAAINRDIDGAKLLLTRRKKVGKSFTPREIVSKKWTGLTDNKAVLGSLDILVNHGYLLEPVEERTGGRPSLIYTWNPRVEAEHG